MGTNVVVVVVVVEGVRVPQMGSLHHKMHLSIDSQQRPLVKNHHVITCVYRTQGVGVDP